MEYQPLYQDQWQSYLELHSLLLQCIKGKQGINIYMNIIGSYVLINCLVSSSLRYLLSILLET